eukprot:3235270-Prymnesium_polylepis.1
MPPPKQVLSTRARLRSFARAAHCRQAELTWRHQYRSKIVSVEKSLTTRSSGRSSTAAAESTDMSSSTLSKP